MKTMTEQQKYSRGTNPNSRNGYRKGHQINLGRKHKIETIIKLSLAKTGVNNPMFGKHPKTAFKSGICSWNKDIPNSWTKKGRLTPWMNKESNPNWKGGITPINKAIRSSLEYEEWRKAVFERDNYTCQSCGEVGGYLQADHIKPFALYPELRLELSNGRALCIECHKQTPTFAGRTRRLSR